MKIKKVLIFAILFLFVSLCVVSEIRFVSFAESNPYTSAKSMVVIETKNNKILYSKNENAKLPMASTTKIATAITVIDNCKNLDEIVKVPKQATLMEGSSIYLKEGEELTVRELLYGLMLQSGNDSAVALALHVSGSIDDFCDLMNNTAKKCGANDTNFKNPHGLDNPEHYTTAYDLAKITSFALKNDDFRDIVSCKKYLTKERENTTKRVLINKNKLLNSLEGCIGVKTGYTSKAGRCLVSACLRDNLETVCVVLNCGPMFEESAALLNLANNEYEYRDVLCDYNYVTSVPVENGVLNEVKIYSKNSFSIVVKKDKTNSIRVEYDYPNILKAPIVKEQVVGTVRVFYENNLVFEENLFTIEPVDSIIINSKLKDILERW